MGLIVDDYCTMQTGTFLEKNYSRFDSSINSYITIMESLLDKGIESGATSDALREFINQVKVETSQTSSKSCDIGSKYKEYSNAYIEELDKVDGVLY